MAQQLGQMVELLQGLGSSDQTMRTKAENMYKQAKESSPDQCTTGLLMIICQTQDEGILIQAAVLLRQHFKNFISTEKTVFSKCTPQTKMQVAAELLKAFESQQNKKVQKKLGSALEALVDFLYEADGGSSWPDLFPTIFRMASGASEQNRAAAVELLRECMGTKKFNEEVVSHKADMGKLIQAALQDQEVSVKVQGVLLIFEMVNQLKKKDWQPLQSTLQVVLPLIEGLMTSQKWDDVNRVLQAMIDTGSTDPMFWKPKLNEVMQLCLKVCKAKGQCQTDIRNLAMEFVVNFAESSPKACMKNVPNFAGLVIEACMTCLLEVDEGDEELKAWMERMDDEEGEEDEEEIHHNAEECIDRVASSLKIEDIASPLFSSINQFAGQPDWKARHAAATACKQTVEYVEDREHISALFKILLPLTNDQHPRVRYMALFALGQLSNDHAGDFQEIAHKEMMVQLQVKMDDPVDRVAAMAMSCFVSFGEELDSTIMISHSQGLMEKLALRLNSSQHRGVREEAITSIAVIAGVLQKDFTQYYDRVMPMLKHFVMNATGEKENRLRGKAFECMSLLGMAVGKDKFKADAAEALNEMFKVQCADDDVQKEYIKEACERIATCLKKDFAPFLTPLLPTIFDNISLDKDTEVTTKADDDDEDCITVEKDGKFVKVKTSKFESMQQSVQLLKTFAVELEGAYAPHVAVTAQKLQPLLQATDEVSMLCDEARSMAYSLWAELIKVAKVGIQEGTVPSNLPVDLLKEFLKTVIAVMEEDDDPETKGDAAQGVADCIKNAGAGCIVQEECHGIIQKMMGYIDKSLQESAEDKKKKDEEKDEDEEDEDLEDPEDNARRRYEEAIGAVMKANPDACVPVQQPLVDKMKAWLPQKDNKVLALYLACDLLEHMGERNVPLWPQFMEEVVKNLHDEDPDARQAAAYAVNLASKIPQFGAAAPTVFKMLAQWLAQKAPKKREEKAKAAVDNAVAAMMQLAFHHHAQKPPEIDAWMMVLDKLPLRNDQEEGKKAHYLVMDLLLKEYQPLLGPNAQNLGKVLGCLAEIYEHEGMSDKELDKRIEETFKKIPDGILQQHATNFSEKQKLRIQKFKTSPATPGAVAPGGGGGGYPG